jgi:hypothetical protein
MSEGNFLAQFIYVVTKIKGNHALISFFNGIIFDNNEAMKILISVLTSFFIFFQTTSEVPYSIIEKAMKANDSKAIISLAKDKIVLQIQGKEGAFNHTQAEILLQDFFNKKPKGEFTFNFKGKMNSENVTISVGTYTFNVKESYRCTFQFRTEKGISKMESLSIERQ